MYLQDRDNVFDLIWTGNITYGEVYKRVEWEQSSYSFDYADRELLFKLFSLYENEAKRLLELNLVYPAYDYILKCSHTFNNLDARGAISVAERAAYIGRVRTLARLCAECYLEQREAAGYPLMAGGATR